MNIFGLIFLLGMLGLLLWYIEVKMTIPKERTDFTDYLKMILSPIKSLSQKNKTKIHFSFQYLALSTILFTLVSLVYATALFPLYSLFYGEGRQELAPTDILFIVIIYTFTFFSIKFYVYSFLGKKHGGTL